MSADKVLNAVAEWRGFEVSELRGRSRKAGVAMARQLAMYALYKSQEHHNYAQVGRELNRDPATVRHGIRAAKRYLLSCETAQAEFQYIVKISNQG